MDSLPHGKKGIITEIGPQDVVIQLENQQTLSWPKHLLKDSIQTGEEVHLVVFSDLDATEERERLAKHLLHEILREQ